MKVSPLPTGRLTARGRWLVLAQLIWLILFVLTTVLFLDGLRAIWNALPIAFEENVGISPRTYGVYHIALNAFLFLSYAIAGLVIFRGTSDKWFTLVITLAPLMLLVRITPSFSYPLVVQLALAPLRDFLSFLGASLLGLTLALFPDGRFIPRWTRLYALFVVVYAFELFYLNGVVRRQLGSSLFHIVLDASLVALGVAAQVYRYRRVSSPEERQQTRWVLFGLTVGFIGIYAYAILTSLFPQLNEFSRVGIYFQMVGQLLSYLALLAVPVTFAIAILRYRLWDIDVVIRRTLVYSLLTISLALFYFGIVILIQILLPVTGQQSQLAIVISTLAIAALFTPLRRRIQNGIDRRFYRRKYNTQQVLARFSETARYEADLERLTAATIQVVQETMQPAHVSLWLRPAADHLGTPNHS
jgi:hypothetical protein